MRKFLTLIWALFSVCGYSQDYIKPSTSPNSTQKKLIKRGYGMFITYGINTFGEIEWSGGQIPVSKYNPTKLDCDQWIRVARDAGFRYVLLTTKHHDGFCLWDSKYTDYDVASSPVKTDVVAEVAKACKKYGIEFAVYYSLWDMHEPCYKDKDKNLYIDYMENQLTELLTNYGDVCEVWFDGGWGRKKDEWQLDRIYKHIKKLQPDCAVGVNHTIVSDYTKAVVLPDSMVVDNHLSIQWFPTDFRLFDPKIANLHDKKQYKHGGSSYYMPFEHTICLSKNWNWYQKKDNRPVRDLDELEELFYWCTSNDNVLLLNLPPDQTGRIREYEANQAIALAKRTGIKKGKPLPKNGKMISLDVMPEASSVQQHKADLYNVKYITDGGMTTRWMAAQNDTLASFTIPLNPDEPFNKISIFEYCDMKRAKDHFSNIRTNRIQSYQIDIWVEDENEWLTVYMSDVPMGDCKVIKFPNEYKTSKLRFKVLKAIAPPSINELSVIYKK